VVVFCALFASFALGVRRFDEQNVEHKGKQSRRRSNLSLSAVAPFCSPEYVFCIRVFQYPVAGARALAFLAECG